MKKIHIFKLLMVFALAGVSTFSWAAAPVASSNEEGGMQQAINTLQTQIQKVQASVPGQIKAQTDAIEKQIQQLQASVQKQITTLQSQIQQVQAQLNSEIVQLQKEIHEVGMIK